MCERVYKGCTCISVCERVYEGVLGVYEECIRGISGVRGQRDLILS